MSLPLNQIVQGDCLHVLKALPSKSIDLVVTDPPYLVNYKDRSGRSIQNDSGTPEFLNAFGDLYRVLKPNSFCVCFYGWNRVDEFFRAWRAAGFRPAGHIVWEKRYTSNARFLQYRHNERGECGQGLKTGKWCGPGAQRTTRFPVFTLAPGP
jgi:DNA modification methylase